MAAPAQNIVMPEQGRQGLVGSILQPTDRSEESPDNSTSTPVYLMVYQSAEARPRDWHWSISWRVGRRMGQIKAWRHIHITTATATIFPPVGSPFPQQRYVHWGGVTRGQGAMTACARRFCLGEMSLATRKRIEEIALHVPVMALEPYGRWNCQSWIMDLAERLIRDGIISRSVWEAAKNGAYEPFHYDWSD